MSECVGICNNKYDTAAVADAAAASDADVGDVGASSGVLAFNNS